MFGIIAYWCVWFISLRFIAITSLSVLIIIAVTALTVLIVSTLVTLLIIAVALWLLSLLLVPLALGFIAVAALTVLVIATLIALLIITLTLMFIAVAALTVLVISSLVAVLLFIAVLLLTAFCLWLITSSLFALLPTVITVAATAAFVACLVAILTGFIIQSSQAHLAYQVIVLRFIYYYLLYHMIVAQAGWFLALLIHPYQLIGGLYVQFEWIAMLALIGIP